VACTQSLYRTAPKGKTQDYVNQVMVPFTASHVLTLIGGTLIAALIGGYIAQNGLKK